jgi:hypothetical protein
VLIGASSLPVLRIGEPRSATTEIAIRPMFFAERDARARPVELTPSSRLGFVALGPRTGWRGGSWNGVRAGLTTFCGPEPPIVIQRARWLTVRPRRGEGAIDVRIAEGDFDGKSCAFRPETASSVTAPMLSPEVPLFGYRACDEDCGDESLVLIMPGAANLLVESDVFVAREEGPFTVLRIPLQAGASTSIVGRILQKDAAFFREDLELPVADDVDDRELAVEVSQSRADAGPVVAVFVGKPASR